MEIHVNWLAIFVASLAQFFLGWVWYSVLFTKSLAKEMGFDKQSKKEKEKRMKGMPKALAIDFALILVTAWVLAHVIQMSAAFHQTSGLATGLKTGFFVWLGFYATTLVSSVIWEGRSWKLYSINAGFYFVGLLLAGSILGVWK